MKILSRETCIMLTLCIGSLHASVAKAQISDYSSLESLFREPVTTSATGTPQRASEVAANMTISTADEIRQSGSRSLPEILSRVPGLDILREGINGYDVGIRGYQQAMQSRLLVLVDGRQVFLDDFSRTVWANIPVNIDDIRQIEVVKGASSALFGTNAAGGVINIVTYNPLYDSNNVAHTDIGTQKERTGDFTATFHNDWIGTKISAGGMNVDEFTTPRGEFDTNQTPYHRYITNSSVMNLTPKLQINTEITYAESTDNAADPTAGEEIGAEKLTTYSFKAGAAWDTPYGLISTTNYFNHSFYNIFEQGADGLPFINILTLLSNQLQDEFTAGPDHTFRNTLEQRYKTYRNGGFQLVQPVRPEVGETTDSIGGMWLWQISDRLTFTNAIRGDHVVMSDLGQLVPGTIFSAADYSHVNNTWSANSNINYKITDLDSLRIGYGRGIQQPSFIESGYQQTLDLGVNADFEGNPKLNPTIVQDYSIDYDRKIPQIFSDAKISVFYELNHDIVFPFWNVSSITINGIPFIGFAAANIGDSKGIGGEIEIKGNHDGFRWDASYSLASLKDQANIVFAYNYQDSAPEHHFRFIGGYTKGNWEFDGNIQYVTSTELPRYGVPVVTDGYSSFSGRIGYNINDNLTLALSGTDLAHKVVDASPYPLLERQVFLGLTGRF